MLRSLFALVPLSCEQAPVATARPLRTIAFGSCANQNRPQPIWEAIRDTSADLFLFLGDNVYADTTDPVALQAAYDRLGQIAGFRALRSSCPVLATWDDHDYGVSDGGREHPTKSESQRVFLDFFGEPAESPRRRRAGVYDARIFGPAGKRVQVILLDTRFHRSPLKYVVALGRRLYLPDPSPSVTMLGEQQWTWLQGELRKPAELRLIASSIQVLPDISPAEKWMNFPREHERLLRLIDGVESGGVILLSGDQHLGEISKVLRPSGYALVEVTASGMTHTRGSLPAPNRHRIAGPLIENHFGAIVIDWSSPDPMVEITIRGEDGTPKLSRSFQLRQLSPAKA